MALAAAGEQFGNRRATYREGESDQESKSAHSSRWEKLKKNIYRAAATLGIVVLAYVGGKEGMNVIKGNAEHPKDNTKDIIFTREMGRIFDAFMNYPEVVKSLLEIYSSKSGVPRKSEHLVQLMTRMSEDGKKPLMEDGSFDTDAIMAAMPGPEPTAPAKKTSENAAMRSYTVQAGDTLGKLAEQFHTTAEELARLNNIANPDLIEVGQALQLPTTQEGEESPFSLRSARPGLGTIQSPQLNGNAQG